MLSRVAQVWRQSLKQYPVATNTGVYASFYLAAELMQQTYNKMNKPEKPDIDLTAAARISAVGSTLYAPTLYYWYKFLDRKFAGKAMKTVITKVAADQFLMTPVLLASFFTIMSVVERKEDIFAELREKYWMAFMANQSFWIPAQMVNFSFMPPHLRVVYVATASFLWINVLCFIKRQKTGKEMILEVTPSL
ncbi:mpv17-like protein isoform X2 [Amyelois transitella]|nr:mpv17-like protein isoform X2 [Amyelois transitella]